MTMTRFDIDESEDRREFLKSCGKFAAVTPPVMTLLLSTSLTSTAIAGSGGHAVHRGNDYGHDGHDGRQNDKEDRHR
jgi:hypothetical protein